MAPMNTCEAGLDSRPTKGLVVCQLFEKSKVRLQSVRLPGHSRHKKSKAMWVSSGLVYIIGFFNWTLERSQQILRRIDKPRMGASFNPFFTPFFG